MTQEKVLTRPVIHKVITKKYLEENNTNLQEFMNIFLYEKKIKVNIDFLIKMSLLIDINGFEFIAVDIQRNGIYDVVWVGGVK